MERAYLHSFRIALVPVPHAAARRASRKFVILGAEHAQGMKRLLILVLLAVPAFAADHVLWYRQPATKWNEALPIGNGRLGAMIFGGTSEEHLQLNEDTVWAG